MAAPAPPTVDWSQSEESVPPYSFAPPPEEGTQDETKAWERAWTIPEIRLEASYWSLAGDSGLLHHLQEFSQRLISQTHDIGQEMDGLVHEAKLTGVRMNNVINNFIMLANTQFVENRVYDEDVSQEHASKEEKKAEQQEKTREQREAELIPRVISALKLGIDVIDLAFEKIEIVEVADSDSEDEEGNSYKRDPVLEEKDPYINRSLPFLIGSPQFMEDENVGLVEVMSEDEESDHDNASGEEEGEETDDSETEYSTSDGSDNEDTQRKRTAEAELSTDEDTDSDEEMFSTKKAKKTSGSDDESGDASTADEEDNEEKEAKQPSGGATDLASELAARLGLAVPKQQSQANDESEGEEDESGARDSLPSNKQKHQKDTKKKKKEKENAGEKAENGKTRRKHSKLEEKGDDDLFGGNEAQDDDDLFGKSKGLFSKSKGIFDDDDNDEANEGNLFDDEEKPAEKVPRKKTIEKDHRDEEKGDDAVDKKEKVKKSEDTRPRSISGKLLPKNAVPLYGGVEDYKRKTGLFDDHEEEGGFLGGASEKTGAAKKEKTPVTKAARAPSFKKSDLFDDGGGSDGEDLFGSITGPAAKRPHKNSIGLTVEGYEEAKVGEENKLEEEKLKKKLVPEKKLPSGAVSMFGSGPNPFVTALKQQQMASSEDEDRDSLSEDGTNRRSSFLSSTTSPAASAALKTAEKVKSPGSISSHDSIGFAGDKEDDDDDDDFLFAAKPTPGSKSTVKTTKAGGQAVSQANNKKVESAKPAKSSLFDTADDDDNDDDFFAVTAKPVERAVKPVVGTVVSGADDVKEKKGAVNTSKPTAQAAVKKPAAVSLFDDEDEEEGAEPLFSSKQPQLLTKPNGNNSKARSLFVDDDDLFRPELDENPSVDLFSSQGPLSKPSEKKDTPVKDTPPKDTPKPASSAPASSAPASKKLPAVSKPASTSLFGGSIGSDEEDDLFSFGNLAKPLPSAAAARKDSTEIEEAMEAKEEDVKQDVKKPKRPIGAVSMFGGLDPSALLKGRRPTSSFSEEDKDLKDEKEENKDEDKANTKQEKSPEAVPASKLKLDLFADDIGASSEDLFSSKSEAEAATEDEAADKQDKEEAAAPKPESTKPKKPAGAVSMFGGLDPSAFLKKKKVEVSDEEEDEKSDKEKLPPPETAPKPKVAVRERHDSNTKPKTLLFGAVDDNDEDDLFAATKKKVPPPTAPKSPLPTPTEPSRPEGELPSPEPPRAKKLAGAVSMFGGLDPFAGFKKKSVSVEEDEKDLSPPREEHLKSPTINVDGPPSFLGQALQRSDSVDFDQPAEADTLSSAIKDRPKLNRRRPPSRKARMLAATSTGISFEDVTPTSPTTPTIPEVPDSPSFDSTTSQKSASNEPLGRDKINDSGADKSKSKTADLFGNDDLLDGPPLSRDKPLTGEDEKDNSVFSKDLFGGKSAKFSSSAGKDLFSTSKKGGASSLEKSNISDSKSAASQITDKKDKVEDDLFSQPTAKPKSNFVTDVLNKDDLDSLMPEGAGQKAKAVSSLGDDDDDIFASSSVKSTAGKGSKSKLAADTIKKSDSASASKSGLSETDIQAKSSAPAAASLRDDDIFADSSLNKSEDTKTKSATLAAVAKNNDLEEGKNADDTKNVRPKKAVTKVDTLLSDTTDIFSDIPDPTPKQPKKKAAAKKTVEKKAVFRDDVDDIFAGTSAAVVKPKRDVKKKVTKTATVDSDNIFDDPLS